MMDAADSGVVFEVMDAAECLALLRGANVGRLGVSINALPVVLPVNYAVDDDAVVFRTMAGTKLSVAVVETVVAFEVDDYEPSGGVGWSVLVQGLASEIVDAEQIARARALPLRLISRGGHRDHFVRLEMRAVTGRRVRPRVEESE